MEGNMEDFEEISGVTQTWILHIYELWGQEGGGLHRSKFELIIQLQKQIDSFNL